MSADKIHEIDEHHVKGVSLTISEGSAVQWEGAVEIAWQGHKMITRGDTVFFRRGGVLMRVRVLEVTPIMCLVPIRRVQFACGVVLNGTKEAEALTI